MQIQRNLNVQLPVQLLQTITEPVVLQHSFVAYRHAQDYTILYAELISII